MSTDHHIQLNGHDYKCRQCRLHKEAHNKETKYGKQSQRGVVVLASSLYLNNTVQMDT